MFRANRVDKAQLLGTDDETPNDSKEKGMVLVLLSSPIRRMVIKLVCSVVSSEDGEKT